MSSEIIVRDEGKVYQIFIARWNEIFPHADDDRLWVFAKEVSSAEILYAKSYGEIFSHFGFKNVRSSQMVLDL